MARIIPQRDLRNQNAAIIEAVTKGETFVVTRNHVPVAELRPYTATTRRRSVSIGELERITSQIPRIDFAEFRSDTDSLVDPYL